MLPFGLTTDVSATALAAGGMGAAGAGATVPPQGAGFANALKQVSGDSVGKAGVAGVGEGAMAVLRGAAAEVIRVPAAAGADPAEGSGQGVPLAALAAGPAVAVPGEGGDLSADVPGAVAAAVPEEAVSEELVADAAVPEEPVADAPLSEPPDVIVPALPAAVPVVALPDGSAEGAASPAAAAGARDTGIAPGVPAAGAMPPAAPGGAGALAGGLPAGGEAGLPTGVAAGAAQAAAAASPDLSGNAGDGPAFTAGQATKAGRRFTSELPEEFRAPAAGVVAAGAKGRAGPLGVAPGAERAANGLSIATAAVTAAGAAAAEASPRLAGLLGAETVPAASGQSLAGSGAEPVLTAGTGAAQTAAEAAVSRPAPVDAGLVRAQAGGTTATVAAGDGAETPAALLSGAASAGDEISVPGAAKAATNGPSGPVGSEASMPGSQAAGSQVAASQVSGAQGAGANAGAGPDDRSAARTGIAAVAAAVAATLPAGEDDGLTATSLDPATGADFTTASLRGGDLSGAARTESLQTPNQTQSAHVATQVAAEIARNLKNGQTRFQMRFDPPELGRVEVKMRVSADGGVHAHLIVDRPETLDMFLRDQRGLERALEAAGLTADGGNLQFSLKQDGGGEFASGQDGDERRPSFAGEAAEGTPDTDPETVQRVRMTLAEQRGGLDMRV